eukprot:1032012-Alexandrium_andersonii.AAC.1
MFVLFGNGQKREHAGVGFVIDLRLRRAIKYYDSEGSRLAMLALDAGPRLLLVYTIYAPQSARPIEERTGFYEDLGTMVDRHESSGVTLLLGDWNARIKERTVEDI